MKDLTGAQELVLDAMIAHHAKGGDWPTFRMLSLAVGIKSTNGINDHLRALARKGFVAPPQPGARRQWMAIRDKSGAFLDGRNADDATGTVEVKVYTMRRL